MLVKTNNVHLYYKLKRYEKINHIIINRNYIISVT
jgi:hypothetical protein